jgi:pilus assembly protein Flp/PilA
MAASSRADDGRFLAESGKIVLSCLPGLEGWPLGCLSMKSVKRFLLDQSGVTSIEYALIAAGVAMVIILAVNNAGTALNGKYEMIRSKVQ